jgi:hypothetical protein
MPEPRLLAECNGGDCPWIKRDGTDWLVNGYDQHGHEIVVRIPATMGHQAAKADA